MMFCCVVLEWWFVRVLLWCFGMLCCSVLVWRFVVELCCGILFVCFAVVFCCGVLVCWFGLVWSFVVLFWYGDLLWFLVFLLMGVSLEQTSEKCDRQANTAIHLVERGKKQNNVDSCK